jgi:hypothetical protein
MSDGKEMAESIAREITEIITDLDPKYSLRYQEIAGLHIFTVYDGDVPLGRIKVSDAGVRFRPPAIDTESLHSKWSSIASKIGNKLGPFFVNLNEKAEAIDTYVAVPGEGGISISHYEEYDVDRIAINRSSKIWKERQCILNYGQVDITAVALDSYWKNRQGLDLKVFNRIKVMQIYNETRLIQYAIAETRERFSLHLTYQPDKGEYQHEKYEEFTEEYPRALLEFRALPGDKQRLTLYIFGLPDHAPVMDPLSPGPKVESTVFSIEEIFFEAFVYHLLCEGYLLPEILKEKEWEWLRVKVGMPAAEGTPPAAGGGTKGKVRGGASRIEDRADWDVRVEKIRNIYEMISQGKTTLDIACQREGITPDTYRSSKKRMEELGIPVKTR